MKMMTIASGSSGNCIYIGTENTHILIDAGISRKRIAEGLKTIGLGMEDISALFITHEHSDHIKGLGVLSRKDRLPIYATKGTIRGIFAYPSLGEISSAHLHQIKADEDFQIDDLCIHPFHISHDAIEPVAYTVTSGEDKVSIVTDLGKYDEYIVKKLIGTKSILVEANHDVRLLQVGSYPYYLKQRILGEQGHLSNEVSGRLICELLNDKLGHIILGHLSKENNYEKLAYETVRLEIDMGDNPYRSADFSISVAPRDIPSPVFEI